LTVAPAAADVVEVGVCVTGAAAALECVAGLLELADEEPVEEELVEEEDPDVLAGSPDACADLPSRFLAFFWEVATAP
jgi:hypothetical protein